MKITKIKIKNLFGISETELDGKNVELSGTNGTGKTSIIDAIRYALTNDSERDYVIKKGEAEGEIVIEAGSELYINRKKRARQSDYKSVKEYGKEVPGAEGFLRKIFTPLQLDPVAFCQMPKKEQNRVILDLIEFPWDLNWIREQFGEIPQGVDYEQNILQVLNDIQAENGAYFQNRQEINRDIRNKRAFIADIARDLPDGYQAERWEEYDLGAAYRRLESVRAENDRIRRANAFIQARENKLRGLEAEREIARNAAQMAIARERENAASAIERLKAEIRAEEEKMAALNEKLRDKMELAESQYREKAAKLDGDLKIAGQYAEKAPAPTEAMEAEVCQAEAMRKHLNEYKRMRQMQQDVDLLVTESEELTRKIELARDLPGEILKTATIPIEGFSVENGVPLINGLPISNLSEGEKLELCVDVALSKPNALQIILIDGAEKLSEINRERLYAKCRSKGLQFIAARTSDSGELEVRYL